MRILIVEDDPGVSQTLSFVIETFGHSPFVVNNVEQATMTLGSMSPDVILLDLLLEGTLSTPFIEVARQMMPEKPPRIIILSAMNKAELVAQEHHTDFLAKPFTLEDLQELIEGKKKNPES